ncbi:amidase [Erwinia toletana]|uniref:Amidase n=1 Tax=Winslowiella toletana TaxID=92490 RepID=A0ABS4PBL2_9GAMM|nr:amidase [Winslowiella toletana]MBP2170027.1 amidase [Winslowiella toletana]
MSLTEQAILALTARALAAKIQAGELSATAAIEARQAEIVRREPVILAWQTLAAEQALQAAQLLDSRPHKGALAGVAIGVKDVIDTVDLPTGYGSALYSGFRPAWDASCVAMARRADAIILGKTVTTEFAMASPNQTRNPHNPAHTPGGSSSGSCAAVAANMAQVAYGTQTSGSIIRPASYCGVVGYKPSFGTINSTGAKVLSHSLDTIGVITRNVRDAGFASAQLASQPQLHIGDASHKPRIALFRSSNWAQAGADSQQVLESAASRLAAAGAQVSEVATPDHFSELFAMHDAVMGWEVAHALAFEHRRAEITEVTCRFLDFKAETTLAQYQQAMASIGQWRKRMQALMDGYDLFLTLAAPGEAPEGLSSTGDPAFNQAWTLLHTPCITLPAGRGPKGLPLGIQLVGRIGADAQLLQCAAWIEDHLADDSV